MLACGLRRVGLLAWASQFRRISCAHVLLQEGLGSKAGVSLMFARMRKLTWGMTTWKTGELVVLLLTQTRAWAALAGAPHT